MTSSCDIRRPLAATAIGAALVLAGCSRAPDAPPAAGSKPAAPHAHDHAAAEHDHSDHDHDHKHDEEHHHDHGDHAHPQTLREGVEQLASLAAAVKRHLAADARDDADDAVHGLGHMLEDLQGLVRTSALAAGTKATATKALDDLFECFDTLDVALHAEPGTGDSPAEVHASVGKRIEAAIGALEAAVKQKEEPVISDEDPAAAIIRDAEARNRKERE